MHQKVKTSIVFVRIVSFFWKWYNFMHFTVTPEYSMKVRKSEYKKFVQGK